MHPHGIDVFFISTYSISLLLKKMDGQTDLHVQQNT